MDHPLLGEITSADHTQRIIALAGALAESAVTRVALEYEDDVTMVEYETRHTDLPGLLANSERSVGIHARASTLISVTSRAISWVTGDAEIDAALNRAKKSLGG